ncbi:hypothetical protein D3C87_1955870 [compost metagenome]
MLEAAGQKPEGQAEQARDEHDGDKHEGRDQPELERLSTFDRVEPHDLPHRVLPVGGPPEEGERNRGAAERR